ncbi:hypothetical protein GDO86_020419 [Hymenochirus boettgeri]|uniref:Probetacellulin n=1 Tax=Hymenochirus boettgeri TaxID=247094 RepID=A0A8T2IHJ5_9PIPI|nr:hypothetical protein GDO86_020419 [Hymenochirus boettgeri]
MSGFSVLPYVSTEENSTSHSESKNPCLLYAENCTELVTPTKWKSHFSRCPRKYKHYCIKGKCRFVTAENVPACICDTGYTGSRCEYFDLFYLKSDRRHYVVIGIIAALVSLIFVILIICICTHQCSKAGKKKKNGTEKETLNNDSTTKMDVVNSA